MALVFITLIWGATFVVVKEALAGCSSLLFLAIRFSIATVALGILFRPLTGLEPPVWRGGAIVGALLFSGYALQTIGLRYTTPSKSAFITGLTTPLVPLLAALVYRRAPRVIDLAGIAVATAGLMLLTVPPGSLRISGGDLLTVGCAAAYAAHVLALGHYAARLSFRGLALTQVAVAALLALSTFWWAETPFIRWTPTVITALLITGLLATALAFSLQSWAQQRTSPTHVALIFTLEPVFAAITSYLVAGELLTGRRALGAALILGGILAVELRRRARR